MNISKVEFDKYVTAMRGLSDKAVNEFRDYVIKNGGYVNMNRQDVIDYAFALSTKYGEGSAALAAELYDGVAALDNVVLPAALPAETASYSEVAKTVNGIIKKTLSDEIIVQSVGLLVKDAGQKTIIQNAKRDNAEIAFIARGDTCPFCIALSAQGWRQAGKSDLGSDGEPAHLHANCDCTYGVRFNKNTEYAGYDPNKYKKMYLDAPLEAGEKPTAKNRINAMRREQYAQNKDEINAQKRAAYEKRNETVD